MKSERRQGPNILRVPILSFCLSCADILHEDVDVHQADLDRLGERVAPAVAEGEVGEVDVVAVHELGQTGSQKQQNLRVCEAQKQRHSNPLEENIFLE